MKANQILVAALFALGASHAAMAEDSSWSNAPQPASTVTRAEVLADLQIYRESGLAALDRGDAHDTNTAAHARAEAKYAELRASPHYATLVQRIAAQRGETVAS